MPTASYQYFEIIINNNSQPDSLDVVIESSAQNTKLEGTTLIIDEIQLKSSKLNTAVLEVGNPFRKATFYVYPNPAIDLLNIKTEENENLTVKVYNMSGEEVKSQIINPQTSKTVDVEQLNSGLYLISIGKENGSSFYSRFIKN
jgi:methionine salvage enolase-phosphatase E1